jgi:hypothetical protein
MGEEPKFHSWWQTLPGIITATAGIITALTGLLVVLNSTGFFKPASRNQEPVSTSSQVPEPDSKAAEPLQTPAGQSSTGEQAAATGKTPAASAADQPNRINLFSPENGVQLLVASNDYWAATIDGKEDQAQIYYGLGKEAVYGFKDDRAATFDTFAMLIGETNDYNVKEFELLAGNDSPTGTFVSIGKFSPRNAKLFKTPYQAFTFPPVNAKYLKIKILSTQNGVSHPLVWEYQLLGNLP